MAGKCGKANRSSDGTLPPDAEAAVLVGRSLQGIAHEWNTYGVKTVRDNTWSDGALRGAVQRSQRGHPPVSRSRGHRGCLARHRGPRRLRGRADDPDRPSAGAPSASRVRPSVLVDWAGAHSDRQSRAKTLPGCASSVHHLNSHARDRGCTRPGCTVAGVHCQVHHALRDWADDGHTNVDPAAGAPESAKTAAPIGFHHHT